MRIDQKNPTHLALFGGITFILSVLIAAVSAIAGAVLFQTSPRQALGLGLLVVGAGVFAVGGTAGILLMLKAKTLDEKLCAQSRTANLGRLLSRN